MNSIKSLLAVLVVSMLFLSDLSAQKSPNSDNFKCYPNYVYVQGAGNRVGFINKSTCDYTYSEWSFGDGKNALTPNAVHEYNNSGYYLLRLVVGNETAKDTLFQIINVHNSSAYTSSYANASSNADVSFGLTARSQSALFDCFDNFFADAILVQPKKLVAERNW